MQGCPCLTWMSLGRNLLCLGRPAFCRCKWAFRVNPFRANGFAKKTWFYSSDLALQRFERNWSMQVKPKRSIWRERWGCRSHSDWWRCACKAKQDLRPSWGLQPIMRWPATATSDASWQRGRVMGQEIKRWQLLSWTVMLALDRTIGKHCLQDAPPLAQPQCSSCRPCTQKQSPPSKIIGFLLPMCKCVCTIWRAIRWTYF